MALRLGLAGFGRIGRNLVRLLHRSEDVRIAAIADPADHEALVYLLRYDSVLGRFPTEAHYADGRLVTWGREIPMISDARPEDCEWEKHGVDYVVLAVGRPVSHEECLAHLETGARRVLLCAPPVDRSEVTIIHGVNDDRLEPGHKVISNGSCTAHCAAPILHVLDDAYGIERAHLGVIHAFTREQRLADVPGGQPRLSRAAGENIVPAATNAASVLTEVLPELAGRLAASSMRVPISNGSIVDLTVTLRETITPERVNTLMRSAAEGPYRDVLAYTDDPIVSSDIAKTTVSATWDAQATMVQDGRMLKAIAWFDNSWGYANRVVDLARTAARQDGILGSASPEEAR